MFLEIRCDWLVEGTVVWKEGIRESPQSYEGIGRGLQAYHKRRDLTVSKKPVSNGTSFP